MNEMIDINNLSFCYARNPEQTVLRDINLSVKRGEYVAVLGHNGSGKSTLAKLCNGILLPSGGRVYVGGMDTCDEELLFEIRRSCGMVFQNPDNQIVATITEEDVAFGPENLGIPQPEIRERVDQALRTVGMYEYRAHAPHLLSGGQKQRIAIAGIIAMRPQCIVLDEPTAMLDPSGRNEVLATITKLNRDLGITIVLITHHMNEAAEASRVVVMDHGQIALDGTPREVFVQVDRLRDLDLSVPQTVELLYELSKTGLTLPLGCLTVDECADAIFKCLQKS